MISQQDNRINLSVAEDSKKIAAAAKRDSSAMKTVSMLTLIFLPGTFVAVSCLTLLSTRKIIQESQHVQSLEHLQRWNLSSRRYIQKLSVEPVVGLFRRQRAPNSCHCGYLGSIYALEERKGQE